MLEDDDLLRDHVLTPQLRRFGFDVVAIGRASDLAVHTAENWPDILVLDVGLPDGDGFDLARQVRALRPEVGIVMLTGRQENIDRVRGLTEGADAYLSKPVDIDVLAATLFSLARRLRSTPSPATGRWRLDADGWCLLSPGGGVVAITKAESRLLAALLETPNQLVLRSELIAKFTPNAYDFDPHRLDSLIHRLRKKVERVLGVPLPLNAVHGEGYVFVLI
ncbi:MAG TPA: response regulator transcription factor [Dyella sp.]